MGVGDIGDVPTEVGFSGVMVNAGVCASGVVDVSPGLVDGVAKFISGIDRGILSVAAGIEVERVGDMLFCEGAQPEINIKAIRTKKNTLLIKW